MQICWPYLYPNCLTGLYFVIHKKNFWKRLILKNPANLPSLQWVESQMSSDVPRLQFEFWCATITTLFRPNKKIPVFRLTLPNLNLLVKPRIFSGFLVKNIILCILKGEMPFKMHEITFFFPEKKNGDKYVPTLPKIFRPSKLIFLFGNKIKKTSECLYSRFLLI